MKLNSRIAYIYSVFRCNITDVVVVTRNSICKQHHRLKETIDGIPTETYERSCEGDVCNATSRLQITPIMMAVLMLMTVVMSQTI